MNLIIFAAAMAFLIGCSSSQSKPQKPIDKLYLSMGIQKDPNEKNPILYEIPGRWKAKGTDQDCENSWTELTVSDDKKQLSITQENLKEASTPSNSANQQFMIGEVSRTSLSLNEKSATAEVWEIKMPTLTLFENSASGGIRKVEIPLLSVFSLTSKTDSNFSLTYSRCIRDMQINVGESVTIPDVDLSKSLENVDQK